MMKIIIFDDAIHISSFINTFAFNVDTCFTGNSKMLSPFHLNFTVIFAVFHTNISIDMNKYVITDYN